MSDRPSRAAYAREWRRKNPEKERATKERYRIKGNQDQRRRYREIKEEVLAHYGIDGVAVCVVCGDIRLPVLSIDHIDGTGAKDRKEKGLGVHFYRWLKKNGYPEGYQTLCMNCQYMKRHQNHETTQKYFTEEDINERKDITLRRQ